MTFAYDIVAVRSGAPQLRVFPSSGEFTRMLNGTGSGSHGFFPQGFDTPLPRSELRALFGLWSRQIVVSIFIDAFGLQKKALYGGIIMCRSVDLKTGELKIQHGDIREVLARRYTFGTNGYSGDTPDNNLTLVNKTLSSIAPWIVTAGTVLGYAANYLLPMDLTEGDSVGGDARTYYDYNFTTVDAGLTEIQNVGPDVDFEPMWDVGGMFRWQQRTGTSATPRLSGATFDFLMTAPNAPLFGVKVIEDGQKMATAVFAIGTGSEVDMDVATARVASDLPALERSVSYKSSDQGIGALQQHANADLETFKNPTEQWSYSMLADTNRAAIALGAIHRLGYWDHWWLEDGWRTLRVIRYSCDTAGKVDFDTQPFGGA